ncbi:MAG: dTMP kinase [Puniceicoccaceae bacterium]
MSKESPERNGLLISFEGSEGSGKTTQIGLLSDKLEDAGYEVLVTREPGGTELGEEIRHLLKHSQNGRAVVPEAELLLFAAARAQLVREKILPALDEGKIIICDRFLDSTTVYQGVARQLSKEPVTVINRFAVGSFMPDWTIILDVPAEIGLERVRHRVSDMPDRMEQENIEFYHAVREGYLLLAKSLPDRYSVFDGTQPKELIEDEIWEETQERFFRND